MSNYLLDTNLIYSLTELAIPTNLKSKQEIEKKIKKLSFGISEWSLIEILTTNKKNKEKLIKYILENDIKIIPAFTNYKFNQLLLDFYQSNNLSMTFIARNQYCAYMLLGYSGNAITFDNNLINKIIDEKIECECDYFYTFLLLFQTFIASLFEDSMRQPSGKYRNTPIEKISLFANVIATKSVIEMKNHKNDIKCILKKFYGGFIDKKELNLQLTKKLYDFTLFCCNIFNNIIIGLGLLKYPIEAREVEKDYIKKHKFFDNNHISWRNNYPIKTKRIEEYLNGQNLPPIIQDIINIKPSKKFINSLRTNMVRNLGDKGLGIIHYYYEFIISFYQKGRFEECVHQKQCLIDKNNVFDSLIMSNYPDFVVLSGDIVFLTIISYINKKHYTINKKIVLKD